MHRYLCSVHPLERTIDIDVESNSAVASDVSPDENSSVNERIRSAILRVGLFSRIKVR